MVSAIISLKFITCFGLFILFLGFSAALPPFGGREKHDGVREDLICNVGDDHECVCNRSTGNLDKNQYTPCHEFLQLGKLDVNLMVLRDVNLTARLYTNETYEQYLRRRIAQILSQYCENAPDDCAGTLAEIRSQQRMASASTYELDEKTITVVDDGPIFSRGNVVILRVNYPPGKGRTELAFVVMKMPNTIGINSALILHPTTVKYILSAQSAPLSRVLGGIRIEQFGIGTIMKPVPSVDNTTLVIMVSIAVLLIICSCLTAAIIVIYDCIKGRRQKRQNKDTSSTEARGARNYGTCTEKLFSNSNNFEVPNGRAKSKSVCSHGSNNSSKRAKKKMSKCSNEPAAKVVVEEEKSNVENGEEASPRAAAAYQNIFVCDHSQLPKEYGVEEFGGMEMRRMNKQSLNVQPTRSPFSSDDDTTGFQTFQFPDRPNHGEKRLSFSENIPCVILDNGNSANQDEDGEATEPFFQLDLRQSSGAGFLSTVNEAVERPHSRQGGGGHPFDRPLSRRGSREETQEEGEEETFNDTREDTPVPLGDDQVLAVKPLTDLLKNKNKMKVEKLLLLTSETSDSDEANNSEDDQESALYKPLKNENNRKRFKGSKMEGESSSAGSGEGKNQENEMLERHQYERLLESPMPPAAENSMPKISTILNK